MSNPSKLSKVFLIQATLGAVLAAGVASAEVPQMSVCHVVSVDGGSEFIRVDTPDLNRARRVARDQLVGSWGLSEKEANRRVRKCIPPGGRFANPKVQAEWSETPL